MSVQQIVIDTNVLVAALRSQRGASYRLVSLINRSSFRIHVSVPLVIEYEAVAKRIADETNLTTEDIDDIIDYVVNAAKHWKIHFLWRPYLKDANDDMILELAITAGCGYIITFNVNDFKNIDKFGIEAITPKKFLQQIGELP